MDIGCLQILLASVIAALLTELGVDAIRCHFCTEGKKENAECNLQIAECTNSKHDACFTELNKTEHAGKMYRKGCVNYSECKLKQDLNHEKYCSLTPSSCIYCCNEESNCNAYNTATQSQLMNLLLPVTSLLSVVLGILSGLR